MIAWICLTVAALLPSRVFVPRNSLRSEAVSCPSGFDPNAGTTRNCQDLWIGAQLPEQQQALHLLVLPTDRGHQRRIQIDGRWAALVARFPARHKTVVRAA